MNFLTVMVLSLMILTVSCTKKDNPAPQPVVTPIISLADLSGQWNFQNYQLNGKNYTTCDSISQNNLGGYTMVNLTVNLYTAITEIDLYNVCGANSITCIMTSYKDNEITLDNGFIYTVTNYNSTTKILTCSANYPVHNGIYTFKKQ